ncbi:hypothetical protein CUJ83_00505 [Methanocella sp. CWC-04]|uniref:Uncharacterized protein n=1 Tax=Methanooceanicella nereidis TaxID=2052831 RepID=A0AAP2RBY6_9EURY|nr:hypothetical protein [Methanocella sp. CWC-04]MCD1293477.1 hypothetical protein [Methanocella sp. CWC-04]
MTSIRIWLDIDTFKLYVKLNDRMDNRSFHEKFLQPIKALGFKFDPSHVAHMMELKSPQELNFLIRQLESNFKVSSLEKNEIMYTLGLKDG